MTKLIIYRLSDGLILRTVSCPTHMTAWQFDPATEGAIAAQRTNENYVIDGTPVYVAPPEPDPPTIEELRAAKKTEIARTRLMIEEGGIDLPNGVHIDTDRVAQWQLASSLLAFRSGFITSTKWKTNGMWVDVTLADLEQISRLVTKHVEGCFAHESELSAHIDVCLSAEELDSVIWG